MLGIFIGTMVIVFYFGGYVMQYSYNFKIKKGQPIIVDGVVYVAERKEVV